MYKDAAMDEAGWKAQIVQPRPYPPVTLWNSAFAAFGRYRTSRMIPAGEVPLSSLVPLHPVLYKPGSRSGIIKAALALEAFLKENGAGVSQDVSAETLRAFFDGGIPVTTAATPSGLRIMGDRHHRLAALIALVDQKILPVSVLLHLPIVETIELTGSTEATEHHSPETLIEYALQGVPSGPTDADLDMSWASLLGLYPHHDLWSVYGGASLRALLNSSNPQPDL